MTPSKTYLKFQETRSKELTVTTLPVKKCSGNDRSHFQNTNINIKISAENGQSASEGHVKS